MSILQLRFLKQRGRLWWRNTADQSLSENALQAVGTKSRTEGERNAEEAAAAHQTTGEYAAH